MSTTIMRAAILFALILSVVTVSVYVVGNPSGISGSDYTWRQQAMTRALNIPTPIVGSVTIALALTSVGLNWSRLGTRWLLIAGALLFISAGLITRLYNQPINAIVMTWDPSAPPPDWQRLRDDWWHWHVGRTLSIVAGLIFLVAGYIFEKRSMSAHRDKT